MIMIFFLILVVSICSVFASKHSQKVLDHHDRPSNFIQSSIYGKNLAQNSLPDPVILPPSFQSQDFDQEDAFGGICTFAHLPFTECTNSANSGTFDIGIVGHPFDLGVSYRPGARFGPNGARQGARRLSPVGGLDIDHGVNPFRNWATVTDCGDISNTPFDKLVAIQELEHGMKTINSMTPKNVSAADAVRLITIGGDHTITLPILRALHSTWGRVAVLHFDSHLDTWDPKQLGGGLTKHSEVNHGTMLHIAHEEGLLSNHSNMHLGSRCALFDEHYDINNDIRCGFSIIRARDLDKIGVDKVVKKVVDTVGDEYVYLSVDIDVLDPAFAPATGTIEPGGWTTREVHSSPDCEKSNTDQVLQLLAIINGLSEAGLKIIGSDVVEFTPVYDNAAETTGIVVSQIIYEILQWMVKIPVKTPKA